MGGLQSAFNGFKPLHTLWWDIFGLPIQWGLQVLYHAFLGVGVLETIGAFGLAVIVLTIIVRGILSPLYHFQIAHSRKTMLEQRKLQPELAAIKKKHKGDQTRITQETMQLYKEHGVNPLGQLSGCLPAILQMPILLALYYTFRGAASTLKATHFLFIPNLNLVPSTHVLIHGLPIPTIPYLVVPLLAACSTFVQSKMMQQPPNPYATDQEQQQQQMMKSMLWLMPLMIFYFAVVTPAALGLYWLVSNCVAIIQQYFVNGWGSLRPASAGVLPSPPPNGEVKRTQTPGPSSTVVTRSARPRADRKRKARAKR